MKRIIAGISFLVATGISINASAQDSPMTQKPIISSSQDSASLGTQWPAKGQDSLNRPMKKNMDSSMSSKSRYYYYPSANIYYDNDTRDYMYYDQPGAKWLTSKETPAGIKIDQKDRYPVSYSGNDPWKDNSSHKMKYKVKKDGTIKSKSE